AGEDAPAAAAPRAPRVRAALQPLGEILVESGLLSGDQGRGALESHARTGVRLGQALLHSGAINERDLSRALAEQLELPEIDVSEFEPDRRALELVPEPLARRHRFVPLAIRDQRLVLAMADPLDADVVAQLREYTTLPLQTIVTSQSAVDRLLQRVYGPRYVRVATTELLNRSPEESAYRVLTAPQRLVAAVAIFVFGLSLVTHPIGAIVAFNI